MHMIANAPDHLLSLSGLDPAGLESLLALAAELKADPTAHAGALRGRSVLLHFTKPSTRTRVSFEAAVVRLGGTRSSPAPTSCSSAAASRSPTPPASSPATAPRS